MTAIIIATKTDFKVGFTRVIISVESTHSEPNRGSRLLLMGKYSSKIYEGDSFKDRKYRDILNSLRNILVADVEAVPVVNTLDKTRINESCTRLYS